MSSSWGSPPCRDTRRWLNRLFLAVLLVPGVALPATLDAGGPSSTMTVVDLIAELEDRGEVFVYSTDLVRPSSVIEIPERGPLTVDDLRRGLEALNLTLERGRGDTWLIVPLQLVVDPGAASGSLEGRVMDAQSGKPLAGVKVEIGGITTYTDVKGRFSLPVSGARAVQVSHDGYMPRQLETQQSLSALLEIPLDPYPRIEEVIVVSSRYALRGGERASQHSIDAYEVDAVPELGDDALRVANHLPGAASIGLSAQPHFRGGLRDETLVLFNGVELLEPFGDLDRALGVADRDMLELAAGAGHLDRSAPIRRPVREVLRGRRRTAHRDLGLATLLELRPDLRLLWQIIRHLVALPAAAATRRLPAKTLKKSRGIAGPSSSTLPRTFSR